MYGNIIVFLMSPLQNRLNFKNILLEVKQRKAISVVKIFTLYTVICHRHTSMNL